MDVCSIHPWGAMPRFLPGLKAGISTLEERMTDIYKTWMRETGLDGFRIGHFLQQDVHTGAQATPETDAELLRRDRLAHELMYLTHGQPVVYRAASENVAILHYHRPDGNYEGWGLHLWGDVATPTEWGVPLRPTGQDGFGVYFRIPLTEGAKTVSYIIHKGDEKDLPDNQSLDLPTVGHEAWRIAATEGYLLPQSASHEADADLGTSAAHWIDRATVAWKADPSASLHHSLAFSAKGDIAYAKGDLTGDFGSSA